MNLRPQLAILLSLHESGAYLINQIESIYAQTYPNISLWVKDDDIHTPGILEEILKRCEKKYHRVIPVHRISFPNKGFVSNFLTLVSYPEIEAEYFAFCDHDDVWHKDKIEHALKSLQQFPKDHPNMYCGRTRLVDEGGNLIGHSPLFKKTPSFRNALAQNIGGGNTMVFNRTARNLLKTIGLVDVASHDWWVYIIVTGVGGTVIYDKEPKIDYRQHGNNMVGANVGWKARLLRFRQMLGGRFKKWGNLHIQALEQIQDKLTPENKITFETYKKARSGKTLFDRLKELMNAGVYRQTKLGNIGLYIATMLKKI